MKRPAFSLLLSLALIFSLAACAGSPSAEDDRLAVVASFYPMYDFAAKIGGDLVNIRTLVPAGAEPHDWEPSVSDIKALEQADVFILNGIIETWAADLLDSSQNGALLTVTASEGLQLLGSGEHGIDGHVWLNPKNAAHQAGLIRDAFISADPDNRESYQKNYDRLAAELETLDRDYRETLAPYAGRAIVVAHESFGYICAEYGIVQIGVEGLSPDSEPEPRRMAEIVDFVRQNNITTIFFEGLLSPRVADAIARETGAETAQLNPLEGLTQEQLDSGEEYLSIMRENLAAIAASFGGE